MSRETFTYTGWTSQNAVELPASTDTQRTFGASIDPWDADFPPGDVNFRVATFNNIRVVFNFNPTNAELSFLFSCQYRTYKWHWYDGRKPVMLLRFLNADGAPIITDFTSAQWSITDNQVGQLWQWPAYIGTFPWGDFKSLEIMFGGQMLFEQYL